MLARDHLRLLDLARALYRRTPVDADLELPAPVLVRRHRLGPLAFCAGQKSYRTDYAAAALAALRHQRQLDEAIAALVAAAIPVALIKGISYATTLYQSAAERPMADIDLLVPPGCHAAAQKRLGGLGYRPGTTATHHHATMLVRGEDVIDLHRGILSPRVCRIDSDAVWRRAGPARERNDGAQRLDPVDEALYHFAALGRTALCGPLTSYLDGAWLLARLELPQIATLHARAHAYRVARVVAAGVDLSAALFGEGAEIAAHPRWPAPSLDEVLSGVDLPPTRRRMRTLALCDRPRQAAGWLTQWAIERSERIYRGRRS